MDFEAVAHLIAFDVEYSAAGTPNRQHMFAPSVSLEDSGCTLFDERHLVTRWSRLDLVSSPSPMLFGCTSGPIYLHAEIDGKYCRRDCIISLSVEQLRSLVGQGNKSSSAVDAVVESFLPIAADKRVWRSSSVSKFGRILFMSLPSAAQLLQTEVNEDLAQLARDLKLSLEMENTAVIPSILRDLIALGSVWVAGPDEQLTVVWLSPVPSSPGAADLRFPQSLFDLLDFLAAVQIVNHLSGRLERLPLGKNDAPSYLQEHQASVLRSYLARHLSDREKTLGEILETSLALQSCRRTLQKSCVTTVGLAKTRLINYSAVDHPRKYDLLRYLVRRSEEALENYDRVKSLIETRDSAVKDYLRDFLSAEVAFTNLHIQQRIRNLTAVAAIIGVMALGLGLLPDEIKRSIWNSLAALTSALLGGS